MTRFLCCGDLQLNERSGLGPDRLDEQADVWQRIVGMAADLKVDALLFGGDAFEHRRPTPRELSAFQRPLVSLHEAGIPALAILGNHDRESSDGITGLEVAAWESCMSVYREPSTWSVAPDVTVCALPWVPVSRLVADAGGGDRDDIHRVAGEHLLTVARGLRTQVDGAAVLLVHWSVTGASLPSGLPVEMAREVIVDSGELEAMGWDAIVCAHVHKSQFVGEDYGPFFYVGSPLPMSFGEPGEHGCWLLEGPPFTARFIPIESRRFVTVDVDLTPVSADDLTDVLLGHCGSNGDISDTLLKLRYRATREQMRRVDLPRIRRALADAGVARFFPEPDAVRVERARVEAIDETLDDLAAFDLYLDARQVDEGRRGGLRDLASEYLQETPA